MNAQPTNLSLAENLLVIEWSDGQKRRYHVGELRHNCPCATCNTRRMRSGDDIAPSAADPSLTISQMHPVGSYAYKISFSDGHDTGFFTLDLLRRLGREAE